MPVERLNLFAPQVRANPYPHYAELRRSAPVSQIDPGPVWAVSRYDDIISVFKNTAVFSSQGLRPMTIQPWIPRNPISESLVLMDPPRHTLIRKLVSSAFTARQIAKVEDQIAGANYLKTLDFVDPECTRRVRSIVRSTYRDRESGALAIGLEFIDGTENWLLCRESREAAG